MCMTERVEHQNHGLARMRPSVRVVKRALGVSVREVALIG
jgi:hypothetical protein